MKVLSISLTLLSPLLASMWSGRLPGLILALGMLLFLVLLGYGRRMMAWILFHRLQGRFSFQVIYLALKPGRRARLLGSTIPVEQRLRHAFLSSHAHDYQYHLISAPEGGGKTTLLIRLFVRQGWPWSPWKRVLLLSAASPDTLSRMAKTVRPAQTLLLIDGLDEDSQLALAGKSRLDAWLTASQDFGKVIFSCSPGYWPAPLHPVAEGEAIRYTGEETATLMAYFPLAIAEVIAKGPWPNPVYGLGQPGRHQPRFRVERLGAALSEWQVGPGLRPAHAEAFWQAVVQEMALRDCQGVGFALPATRLYDLHERFAANWKLDLLIQGFLWRDGEDLLHLQHHAIAAYFLSQVDILLPPKTHIKAWNALPLARAYRQERAWMAAQAHSQADFASFRVETDRERRPLTDLQPQEVLAITRLYLPVDMVDLAMGLLPDLHQLRGLYLIGGTRQSIPSIWLEALPHDKVMLYFLDKDDHIHEVWQYQDQAIEWQGSQQPLVSQASSLEPVSLQCQPLSEELLHPGTSPLHDRGMAHWLRAELGTFLTPLGSGSDGDPPVIRLPIAAWDLFQQIQLWPLAGKRYNVILNQVFPSSLLVAELRQITQMLVDLMGEDDAHLRELSADDEAQIADGFWTGRSWQWGNTDQYASPVHLFLDQPGCATLIVWNVTI